MRPFAPWVAGLAATLAAAPAPAADPPLHAFGTTLPVTRSVAAPAVQRDTTVRPLATWKFSVTASPDLGGGNYAGRIVGSNPYAATKASTTIKTQIVPLVITIDDGRTTRVYDPTQPDGCNGNLKAIDVVQQSPIFRKNTWIMNGVAVGTTQYIDAFQRAEFWSQVHGTNYHVLLQSKLLPAQAQSFMGAANGLNVNAKKYHGCGYFGIVALKDIDARVQALITGPLAGMVNAGTFPIFITRDVAFSIGAVNIRNCCAAGYHAGFKVGGNLQIYSPFAYDSTGVFALQDVGILSHEMGEAINDPAGSRTPVWGNIGQVKGQCQGNFEVGDPLTPGYGTPSNTFVVKARNGFTYHVQELAYFSWYFGGPSLGAGGKYSDNGSFGGDAILCSKGGGTH